MPEAEAPQAGKAKAAKAKAPAEKKEPSGQRTIFKDLYPEDAPLKATVEKNPKKAGSKAAERFEYYFTSETVGDFLAKGGTYQDIAYDLPRGFIKVG